MLKKILKLILHPRFIFLSLAQRGFFRWMSDEMYLRIAFRCRIGKKLNLEAPKTFNEKIQWLKLNDRNPRYTSMVDKYEAKIWAAGVIGEEYIIPTIGVWDRVEDIDFSSLPEHFVLKCTHDSGGVSICSGKSGFDVERAKKKLRLSLKRNYYYSSREWPYHNIKPRIIAEKFIGDAGSDLLDYKIMMFNGEPKCLFVCTGRSKGDLRVTFFDMDFNRLPFYRYYKSDPEEIKRPESLDLMIELARRLSKGLLFLRVDFYEIGSKPYLGELTFYPGCGFEYFRPEEWDLKLGDLLSLPDGKAAEYGKDSNRA